MNRNKAYILNTIDEYRQKAKRENMGRYFEPRALEFPEKVTICCTHCGKNQKIDSVSLWPNVGVMAAADLPLDDVSIIVNCPVCGTRIAMSRNSVKKSLDAKGAMIRTVILLVIVLLAAVFVGGTTLLRLANQKYLEQGRVSLREGEFEEAFEAFEKAGKWGNADALYLLGECYRDGTGVAADAAKAKELFVQALEKGSGLAKYEHAKESFEEYLQTNSRSTLNQSVEELQDSDSADAKYMLSVLTRAGIGVKADTAQANELLSKAANAGSVDALCDGAQMLVYQGRADEALEMLYKYSDQENPDIMAAEGYAQLFSNNSGTGTTLLSQAESQGSSWANYYWGQIYYNSLLTGADRDIENAAACYQKAADAGNLRARYEYALCLYVMGDRENAIALAKDCYNRGYVEAACILGNDTGDETQKLNYMTSAAQANYSPAEIWMGWYYSDKDPAKCEEYLYRAYQHGARFEANRAMQSYFGYDQDYFGASRVN